MFKGELYPYQVDAVEQFIGRGNLLLAYGCGTGKTVIAIAAVEKLRLLHDVSPALIICPASLKYQWSNKISEFTNSEALVIDGTKKMRVENGYDIIPSYRPRYIVIGYDAVIHDYEQVSKLSPGIVILDEVSAIKSFKAIRSKRIKRLFGKAPYRLGLTATPIENRPEELYSIMQWVDNTVLGRYDLFEKAYIARNPRGWISKYKNLDTLRGRMGDALARKTRHDPEVRPYLPDVDEGNWNVPMTKDVFHIYQIIAEDMLQYIRENIDPYSHKVDLRFMEPGFDESTPDGKLMAMHMCMEMLLDHPALIQWSAREYKKNSPYGSAYANYLVESGIIEEGALIDAVPKLDRLLSEIDKLLADPGSKIIIVSKYKYMLQLMSYAIPYPTITFNGDMSAKEKALAIECFNHPANRILLTSYAGGYGLDLYMADYLINYDLPWSAGTLDQISSRHIRASSSFDKVYIRNLITENSIEERKQRMLERKARIISAAIDGGSEPTVIMSDDLLRDHLENISGKGLTRRGKSGKIVSRQSRGRV